MGGADHDVLYGDAGNDNLSGGSGSDTLHGGDDADTLSAIGANDATFSSNAEDVAGTINVLNGGAGNDRLYGGAGDDQLNGQADDDTLEGAAGYDSLTGGDGNDVLRVGTTTGPNNRGNATDTLVGGAGDDRLITSVPNNTDAAVLTGGQGADSFEFGVHPGDNFTQQYAWSSVAAPDRITDFNVLEGDVIFTGITNGVSAGSAPLAWRGVAAPGFTATVGQSLALASGGAIETRFLEFWTFYDSTADKTVLFMDRDRDGLVDAEDLKLEFDGNLVSNATAALNLGPASFSAGTIILKLGTSGADSNTNPALGNDVDLAYGLGGNDTLDGLEDDTLNGDAGDDVLSGGLDRDSLFGGADHDVLYGDAGNDNLSGGSGSDTLHGAMMLTL